MCAAIHRKGKPEGDWGGALHEKMMRSNKKTESGESLRKRKKPPAACHKVL